jgi:hypothetical protein
MRTHIHAAERRELMGPEVIEKDERADGSAPGVRKRTLDLQPATDIGNMRFDNAK